MSLIFGICWGAFVFSVGCLIAAVCSWEVTAWHIAFLALPGLAVVALITLTGDDL